MAGRKGRSGRPKGSRSFSSAKLCHHRFDVLMKACLAGVKFDGLPQPEGRNVSMEVKRRLAEIAIARETRHQRELEDAGEKIQETQVRLRKYWLTEVEEKLKNRGLTEEEINAEYNKFFIKAHRAEKPFVAPSVDQVLKLSRRQALDDSLRRRKKVERRRQLAKRP
jgi:hypothetical protein